MEDLLVPDEIDFLAHHHIALTRVFDAYGLSRKFYQQLMREEGALIACRTNACGQGHTLKTRSGDCPQCRPASLGFLQREEQSGFIYVAHSHSLGLCKVGFAVDHESRERSLNQTGYAGAVDWMVADTQPTRAGGVDERRVHQELRPYKEVAYYIRDGVPVRALETYICDLEVALEALLAL